MRKSGFALLLLAVLAWPADKALPLRWVYISRGLRSDQDVEDIRKIARTASENGLNGVLLASGLDSIDLKPPDYFTRLDQVKEILRENHLEMIPSIFSAGYGGGILAHDKNLAEGLPVKDALYVVKGSQARIEPEIPVADGGPAVEGAWTREVAVRPYRCYRVTFRAKTAGLPETRPFTSGAFRLDVRTDDKRNLTPWNARVPPTSDWREYRWGFNSLWYDKVRISIGVSNAAAGKAWVDGVRVEEIGLLNVLRRPGTPVTVRSDDSQQTYTEGRDFDRIVDPQLNFKFDHEGPPLRLLPGGRIKDGDRLRLSYYHGFSINDGQTTVCMGEPKTYEIWRDMARRMHAAAAPPRYVLSMDEIREGGTCEACRGRNMGQLLGECLTRQFEMLREANPKVDVWVWSDMLDPNHNAHGNYYLVQGDYTGSWNHVPKEMGIVTWYYERRALSLPFFSKLGFRTLAGAYYDADSLDNPRGWLEELQKTPRAQGIMYTTWQNKYGLLADFGRLVSATEK
ncbi:MAG TPA: hypothetical protein VGF59_07970 [Bryobacteraceae bacterium]|jgi:hypothetical protein